MAADHKSPATKGLGGREEDADMRHDSKGLRANDNRGRVRGEIVAPTEPEVEPRIVVREEDSPIAGEKETEGAFELGYERKPEGTYTLEVDAPGMKSVSVPLPSAEEDVGRIVLQPALVYRAKLMLDGRPASGVKVALQLHKAIPVSSGDSRTEEDGTVALTTTSAEFSHYLTPEGNYADLSLAFEREGSFFQSVPARLDGFRVVHVVELSPAPNIEFVLRSREDGVPFRLEQGPNPYQDGRYAPFARVVDSGKTNRGGKFAPRWPEGIRLLWIVVGASGDETWFPMLRDQAVAASPVELNPQEHYVIRVRLRHGTRKVPGANIAAYLLSPDASRAFGWIRGVTGGDGDVTWRVGRMEMQIERPPHVASAEVLYALDGVPAFEFLHLRKRRGVSSRNPVVIKLGKQQKLDPLHRRRTIWFTCRDADGNRLTPTRVSATFQGEFGLGHFAGGRPRKVAESIAGRPDLFEASKLAVPREGRASSAGKGLFTVVTAERGKYHFDVTADQWRQAASANSPLAFVYPAPTTLRRRLRVVDASGVPVPRAWVTICPIVFDDQPYVGELMHAATDSRGVLRLRHLAEDGRYQIYVRDLRDDRSGWVEHFEVKNAAEETTVLLAPPVRFQAELELDTEIIKSAEGIGFALQSVAGGAMPRIHCIVKDGKILAPRATGLEGYVLYGHYWSPQESKLYNVTIPAAEAHGQRVRFP
ncbi:MAG: hypothetical protein AAGD14_04365 [Planctomycetota bacterium]